MDIIGGLGSCRKYTDNSMLNSSSGSNGSESENSNFVAVLQQEDHSESNQVDRENVDSNNSEVNDQKKRSRKNETDLAEDDSSENNVVSDELYVAAESVTPEDIVNIESTDESPYSKYLFADYNTSNTDVEVSAPHDYITNFSDEVTELVTEETDVAESVIADVLGTKTSESPEMNAGQVVSEAAKEIKDTVVQGKMTDKEINEVVSTTNEDNGNKLMDVIENVVQTAKADKVPQTVQSSISDSTVAPTESNDSSESVAEVVVQSIADTSSETITVKTESAVAGNENNLRQNFAYNKTESGDISSTKLESADVKILDVKYNQTADNSKQDTMSGDTASQQDSEGLLKTLTGKMNNFMQRFQNRQQANNTTSSESSVFSSSRANTSIFKNAAASVSKETIKNAVDTDTTNTDSDSAMKALSGLNVDSPRTGLAEVNGLQTGNSASSTVAQATSSAAERVEVVERIVETVQQYAPIQNTSRESNITLNVEVNNLGKMQLFLEQKETSLKVVIESDTEQGRQEMMDQKDELAQQLRMMGYKELSVEVGSQNQQQNSSWQQEKNSASGNEDSDNVKLAGNDELDLAEILSMA